MKRTLGIAAAAALALTLALPASRNAWGAVIDLVTGSVGSALPVDSGKKHTLLVGASDGVNTQNFSLGSAADQGAAASSNASLQTVAAADKAVNSTPAVNTQASASIAAGGATLRHISTSCSGSINTVAAQPAITLSLRDGATGAGTVLWSQVVTCALGSTCTATAPPVNVIGTANTAATCEWSGIPAVGNFEVTNLTYHDAS